MAMVFVFFLSGWSVDAFVWPQAESGTISLTQAQLSMLLEGIDWRRPARTWKPEMAV
jgi:transposase